MTKSMLLILAWKNFRTRTVRNLLVAFGISIGLIGILTSLGLGNGVTNFINQGIENGSVPQQIQVGASPNSGSQFLLPKDKEEITRVVGPENIEYFELISAVSATSYEFDGKTINLDEDNSGYFQLTQELEEKKVKTNYRDPQKDLAHDGERTDGIMVPKSFVDNLNQAAGTSYSYADLIGQNLNAHIIQRNATKEKTNRFTAPIIRVFDDSLDIEGSRIYLTATEMQRLLAVSGFTPQIFSAILQPTSMDLTPELVKTINDTKKYNAIAFTGILDTVKQFIQIIQGLLIFMSGQAIAVSTLLLGIVLYINAIERTKEIGIMKAIGYKNRDIFALFMLEAFVITAVAILFSFAITLLIGLSINSFAGEQSADLQEIFLLPLGGTLITIVGAFTVSCFGSFFPARKAGAMNTVDALRYE